MYDHGINTITFQADEKEKDTEENKDKDAK